MLVNMQWYSAFKKKIEIEYTINLSSLHKKLDGWIIIRNFQMLIKSSGMNFTMTQNLQ